MIQSDHNYAFTIQLASNYYKIMLSIPASVHSSARSFIQSDDLVTNTTHSATTIWMGAICIIALIERYYFNKHPIEAPEAEEVIAAEISRQRERCQISTNMKV